MRQTITVVLDVEGAAGDIDDSVHDLRDAISDHYQESHYAVRLHSCATTTRDPALRRKIDEKFHIDNWDIVKTSNGQLVPHDEPLFLVRARDYLAVPLLRHYYSMCERDGCTEYQLTGVAAAIGRFEKYAVDRAECMKQPGITKGY